jgi:hypothetical protein
MADAQGDDSLTLTDVRKLCRANAAVEKDTAIASRTITANNEPAPGAITHRILIERKTHFKPYDYPASQKLHTAGNDNQRD